MIYTDKEKWIEAYGVWLGIFSVFGALSITLFLKTIEIKPDTWIYGTILSTIFFIFAIYAKCQAEKEVI